MADLVKTYQFDLNRLMPIGSSSSDTTMNMTMWTMVHQLLDSFGVGLAAPWTHAYSSNGYGSGGSHSLTVNQWWNGGTFLDSLIKEGYTSASNNGAMFALRAPEGFPGTYRPTILFVRDPPPNGYTYDWQVRVTCGEIVSLPATMGTFPTAVFPGGAPAPWATSASGVSANSYDWPGCVGSGDVTLRNCHLVIADDGGFFWASNKFGGGARLWQGVGVFPFEDAQAEDVAPWAFFVGGPTWGDASPAWPSSSYSSGKSAWSAARLAGRCDITNYSNGHQYQGYSMLGVNAGGTAATGFAPSLPMTNNFDAASNMTTHRRLLTRLGGGAPDPVRGTYPEFPVWVSDSVGNVRGRLRDLWLTYPFTEGTVEPDGVGPVTRMVWGEFWVPSPDIAAPIVF